MARPWKVGALFAGYAGLDLAVESVLGATLEWVAEIERAPSLVLAHHYPDVPNLGDVTKVDWASVAPVDVITGGSPCQDLSQAGARKGMRAVVVPAGQLACGCQWAAHDVKTCQEVKSRKPKTLAARVLVLELNERDREDPAGPPPERRQAVSRSGLWASMCDAIEIIRPRLVVWENVRGAYSAEADSNVEQCPFCMGDGSGEPNLRALGRVLGDLSEIGYDATWVGIRAADVGAPHGRFRVFVVAWPADASSYPWREFHGDGAHVADADGELGSGGTGPGEGDTQGFGGGRSDDGGGEVDGLVLLPTPAVNDMGDGKTLEWWDEWAPRQMSAKGVAAPHGKSLAIEALRMLPSPRASGGAKGGPNQRGSSGDLMLPSAVMQMLPTPVVSDAKGANPSRNGGAASRQQLREAILPTPTAMDTEASGGRRGSGNVTLTDATVRGRGLMPTPTAADGDRTSSHYARGNATLVGALLPTPQTSDANGAGEKPGQWADRWQLRDLVLPRIAATFGDYAPAVARWESVIGREVPTPTEPTGKNGDPRLSPRFTEWMMGLPDGWVTDVPGLSRREQLTALGNGVVPQQAAAAIRMAFTLASRFYEEV